MREGDEMRRWGSGLPVFPSVLKGEGAEKEADGSPQVASHRDGAIHHGERRLVGHRLVKVLHIKKEAKGMARGLAKKRQASPGSAHFLCASIPPSISLAKPQRPTCKGRSSRWGEREGPTERTHASSQCVA